MLFIRPLSPVDVDELLHLLQDSGHGLTNLPKNRNILLNKLEKSSHALTKQDHATRDEIIFFGQFDSVTNHLIGVCGIIAQIGINEPYYFYHVKAEEKNCALINQKKIIQTMHLEKTESGPSEICSLYLSPKHRKSETGRFLSLSRFLFIKEHPDYYEPTTIAEMRGMVEDNGESIFWNHVGSRFVNLPFLEADALMLKSKSFIENLFPKHPILIDLLPKDVQAVIGEVHSNTMGARKILEKEGFHYNNRVGVLEPGPLLEAKTDSIRAIKEAHAYTFNQTSEDIPNEKLVILSNGKQKEEFRAVLSYAMIEGNKIIISEETRSLLNAQIGSNIRLLTIRAN